MEWYLLLLLVFGTLIILLTSGMPVAFCFMLINVVGVFVLWGGEMGLQQVLLSFRESVTSFVLIPLPLFILMGEVMFQSGLAPYMIDAIDKWLGRLPGRLGLVAVAAGTLISTLTGVAAGSVAMMGRVLVPEMEKRGYKKAMSLGPILGSGGLAMMIPPSGLAVLVGAIGEVSIGDVLIGIIVPGLIMAVLYASYIIMRCRLQPSIAPPYEVSPTPLSQKLVATAKYILPIGVIIFLVTGVIILGIATPTEAAATGALGAFILAAAYRRLNWETARKSIGSSLEITVMVFMIIVGSKAFSQILAYSGVARSLSEFAASLPLAPIFIVIAMQVVLLFLGMFISVIAIILITLPIFMPVILTLGLNPVWFAVIFLLNMEMAETTPPYGLCLFVMKGVAPPDTTMGDIVRAGLPFLYCDAIVMALLLIFPSLVLWLPSVMR